MDTSTPAASGNVRKRMRRALAVAAVLTAAGVGIATVSMTAAHAAGGCRNGHFCTFDDAGFKPTNPPLLDSTAGKGNRFVDVANDRVSSGSNRTGNQWVGVNERTGLPDQQIFKFAPNTDVAYVGDEANDRIDHFDVF